MAAGATGWAIPQTAFSKCWSACYQLRPQTMRRLVLHHLADAAAALRCLQTVACGNATRIRGVVVAILPISIPVCLRVRVVKKQPPLDHSGRFWSIFDRHFWRVFCLFTMHWQGLITKLREIGRCRSVNSTKLFRD